MGLDHLLFKDNEQIRDSSLSDSRLSKLNFSLWHSFITVKTIRYFERNTKKNICEKYIENINKDIV